MKKILSKYSIEKEPTEWEKTVVDCITDKVLIYRVENT